jgi:Fe2+ or Zn2+ uptake regulation protein
MIKEEQLNRQEMDNNHNLVAISEKIEENTHQNEVGILAYEQVDLSRKPIPRLRIGKLLTDQQLAVFKEFYYSTRPISQKQIRDKVNVHDNTISRTIDLLEKAMLIKEIWVDGTTSGRKEHTMLDKRYKFYMITSTGVEEFENQINVRPINYDARNFNQSSARKD